ncbi:MAG: hypothetical protein QXL64_03770 [Thermofilaceae archaeon]
MLKVRALHRIVYVEVGEVERAGGYGLLPKRGPSLSTLLIVLILLLVIGAAALAAGLLAIPVLLGAPLLIAISVPLLFYLLSRVSQRGERLWPLTVLISPAPLGRQADIEIVCPPPPTADGEEEVIRTLELALRGRDFHRPKLLVLNYPPLDWRWYSLSRRIVEYFLRVETSVLVLVVGDLKPRDLLLYEFIADLCSLGATVLVGDVNAVFPRPAWEHGRNACLSFINSLVLSLASTPLIFNEGFVEQEYFWQIFLRGKVVTPLGVPFSEPHLTNPRGEAKYALSYPWFELSLEMLLLTFSHPDAKSVREYASTFRYFLHDQGPKVNTLPCVVEQHDFLLVYGVGSLPRIITLERAVRSGE